MKVKLISCVAVLLLSGCSILQPVKPLPVQTYLLQDPISSQSTKTSSQGKTLLVTMPTAPLWLNTPKMVYQEQPDQINYFGENEWASAPSELLQPLIVHALQQSGAFRAVVSAPYAGVTELRLDIRLLQMQQAFWTHPSVYSIVLQAQLTNGVTGQAIAAKRFSSSIKASSDNPQGGASAANEAIAKLLPQIVNFVRHNAS